MEEDLKLCTVRPLVDSDRRFCFEVISPTKSHTLQADSKFHYDAWIKALQSAILCAFEPSNSRSSAMSGLYSTSNPFVPAPSNRPKEKKINWRALLTIAGNMTCADCGNPDPKWASINLGITLW
jgi:Arf-GAP with coiled-coil, ANK repeat and PH domain-containing protein